MVLGDNIFHGDGFSALLRDSFKINFGAKIFVYHVPNPTSFGVVELGSENEVLSIEEKPQAPKSKYAVTGLYFYDNTVAEKARSLKPSIRGELEITDLNNLYLKERRLTATVLGRGFAWLDTGTHDSLMDASSYVASIEMVQGRMVACLEEIALSNNWIEGESLSYTLDLRHHNSYSQYLKELYLSL